MEGSKKFNNAKVLSRLKCESPRFGI